MSLRSLHAREDASSPGDRKGPADPIDDHSTHVQRVAAEHRVEWRLRVKALAREAAKDTCGADGISRSLEIKPETVRHLLSDGHAWNLSVADLMASNPRFRLRMLKDLVDLAAEEHARPSLPPDQRLRRLQVALGKLASKVDVALADDGIVDEDEGRDMLPEARTLARQASDLVNDLEGR